MTIAEKRNELYEVLCNAHTSCDDCPAKPVAGESCDFIGNDGAVERFYAVLHASDSSDSVNHPAHYSGKHECIEIMRVMFGDEAVKAFCRCNSFKYRFRADRKNGDEDIKKAEWYEDYLLRMDKEAT